MGRMRIIPFSQDIVMELVTNLGFPDRFFVDLLCHRRLSAHTTTRTGDCWLVCDTRFSAVTLERTQNNDILSIIMVRSQHRYTHMELLMKRYISAKTYHRHLLFPVLLIADAALEDYRMSFEGAVNGPAAEGHDFLDLLNVGAEGLHRDQRDFAADLARITVQREQLTRSLGDVKAFNASVRNLLNDIDGRYASSVGPGLLRSPSAQARGQSAPIPLTDSTLQRLVLASGDLLVRLASTDARLQNSFLVVSIRDGQGRIPRFFNTDSSLDANPPCAARH
jgi:hypothetical protein